VKAFGKADGSTVDTVLAVFMVGLVVSVMVSVVVPEVRVVSGVFLLLVAITGYSRLRKGQKIAIGILSTIGVSLALGAVLRGFEPTFMAALSINQDIVAMILAVSFVAMVAKPEVESPSRLRGRWAVLRTAVVSHFLGSVINLSAVTLVGDRLAGSKKLTLPNALLLSRTYSIGAYWSPFWAAAAAALTFAPGANVTILVSMGLAFAMSALLLGVVGVIRRMGEDVETYRGYPLAPTVVVLPLILVVLVMGSHWIWPEIRTTNLVLMASLGLTIVLLLWREPRLVIRRLIDHSRHVLPGMRSESILFASAGVLAVGFSFFLQTTRIPLPDVEFGVLFAWLSMIAVIALSTLGVHQIISIGVLATVIAPLNPEPTLFAMACTAAWGTSAAISPIGGLNLYIMGRFGRSSVELAKGNLWYVLGVIVLAFPLLSIVAAIVGVGWY
jgi:hypothetical protein